MANTKGRITISQNPAELLELGTKVYGRHLSDGDNSPLNLMQDYNWSVTGPAIEIALARHNEAEELKGKMEIAYRERDLLLPEIDKILRSSRNLLKALNAKNPKRIADWGFKVDDTPKAPKVPKTPKP